MLLSILMIVICNTLISCDDLKEGTQGYHNVSFAEKIKFENIAKISQNKENYIIKRDYCLTLFTLGVLTFVFSDHKGLQAALGAYSATIGGVGLSYYNIRSNIEVNKIKRILEKDIT